MYGGMCNKNCNLPLLPSLLSHSGQYILGEVGIGPISFTVIEMIVEVTQQSLLLLLHQRLQLSDNELNWCLLTFCCRCASPADCGDARVRPSAIELFEDVQSGISRTRGWSAQLTKTNVIQLATIDARNITKSTQMISQAEEASGACTWRILSLAPSRHL